MHVFQYDAITTETLSASHLLYRSLRVTDCLRHSGIASGDCVAICCENRLEYIYVVCGSIFLGATVVLISADYTTSKSVYLISNTKLCNVLMIYLGKV